MRRLGPIGLLVICGLTASVFASEAQAAPFSLRDLIRRRPSAEQNQQTEPPVAVYAPDNGVRFVFDRAAQPPLLRFETSPEIWVLHPEPGPRGDMIYKNDLGEPVLRATRLGGLTLFTDDRPDGTAVALEGEAAPLRPATIITILALQQHLAQDSLRASHAMQRLIEYDAPDVTLESATLIADAGQVTAEAIINAAKHPEHHRFVEKLVKVLLSPAHKTGVSFKDGVLEIDFAPGQGLAGRPSSRRIEAVFEH